MGQQPATIGGIVLCGGNSRRMGRDKASLPIAGRSLLSHTTGILEQVVSPVVVVVAAPGQPLPAIGRPVEIVRDRQADQGPLEGIASGLRALAGRAEAAYVTAVDVPLLQPAFITAVIDRLDAETDIAVPCDDEHQHALAAVYRVSLLPAIEAMLAGGERRVGSLLATVRTRRIETEDLRAVDPELLSLVNCNRPQDYEAALRRIDRDGKKA